MTKRIERNLFFFFQISNFFSEHILFRKIRIHEYPFYYQHLLKEHEDKCVPSCVLTQGIFAKGYGPTYGWFRIIILILGLDNSKGSQIVPHCRPRETSRAPPSSPITGYEQKGFNLSGSVLRAHTEVDISRELTTSFS